VVVDPNDVTQVLDEFRELGLVVCRGTAVMTISPPGDEISNPFEQADAALADD
jgi:U6 snRNA-associated Sm-like protein LSm7